MVIYVVKDQPILAMVIQNSDKRSIQYGGQTIVAGDYFVDCNMSDNIIYAIQVDRYVINNRELNAERVYTWYDPIRALGSCSILTCTIWCASPFPQRLNCFDGEGITFATAIEMTRDDDQQSLLK